MRKGNNVMAENKFYDYATGKEVRSNPEELYRQLFEHILIDDLGYPKSHIDIEVILQRGAKRNAEEVDIVVYNSDVHKQENAYIIIEIETPKKKYDLQAFSYVTATTAPYCVWFAGFEKNSEGPFYHYRDLTKDPTKFMLIPTLPRYGETQETIGKYRKQDLKPAKALKLLFSRMYYKLYGNGPIKREENIAIEVIKMLFCKIMDEIGPEDLCEFRATPVELASADGKKAIKARIEKLYDKLLKDPDFPSSPICTTAIPTIGNDYIVSELQGIALMHEETNTDALGDAYEILLPSTLKGESGQFFTPREIVRFAMDIINPSYKDNELVLDTACGSGGFLSIAIEKLRKQIEELYKNRNFSKDKLNLMLKDYADKYIYGCDIDPLLYRISKSYMAIVGDGKSNIYNFDSLEPYESLNENFKKRIKPGTVNVITTNPPFGTKIDDTRDYVLEKYELGHKLIDGEPTKELVDGQDPDKLFVERDILYLKDATDSEEGGRMVIVLPKQNLSGAQEESVEFRKWLLKKVQITAIVDLPREAFQPHTGTKTSLVFLKKVKNIPEDYPIFMAVSEAVGHDRRGNPLYKKDASGMNLLGDDGKEVIWNDLPEIYAQWNNYVLSGTVKDRTGEHEPSCFVINSKQILNDESRRIDAWYWDPNKNNLAKELEESIGEDVVEIVRLGDLVVEHGIFYPGRHKRNYVMEGEESVPFYSGTQILQVRPFDLKYTPKDYKPAAKHFVEKNWILITRSGSTGRVVMVTDNMAGTMVSEHVIRVICDETLIDPYYVYAYLSTNNIGKILLERGIYASVVDHITPDFVATIPIPRLKPEKEKEIADKVRAAEKKRDEANKTFLAERDEIEKIMFKNINNVNSKD